MHLTLDNELNHILCHVKTDAQRAKNILSVIALGHLLYHSLSVKGTCALAVLCESFIVYPSMHTKFHTI